MGVKPLFIFILLTTALAARAQQRAPANDTTLKGSAIEIIQSYKPQVKQAPKPEWIPQLPPADSVHPVFSYDVPQQTLYYTYSSLPLRPLALTADSASLPFRNYIKAGGGNVSTLYLDAGIGSISGKDYETAIHLHHISQQGDIQYQQSALSGIEAEGTVHKKETDWHATVDGERNQYNYYGYDHDLYKYAADSLKQVYTTARVCVDMKNKEDTVTGWGYHPAVNASLYNAKFSTHETTFGINAPLTYKIDSNLYLPLALSGTFTNYATTGVSAANNIVALMAGVEVRQRQGINGHALLSLAAGKGGALNVLPDIVGTYTVPGPRLALSGGWLATLRQNTYEQLTTENPYLSPAYTPQQTRRDEVFANAAAGIGNHLGITARVSWWDYNSLATFLNDVGDQKQYYIDYINAEAISFQGGVRYHVANVWSVGVTGDFYSFYGNTPVKVYVWGAPDVKIKGDFSIVPLPKLTVTAYLALLSGIWERNINGQPVKSAAITDLGGNAEYQVVRRLSAFVQIDNLLNEKYQRWAGYQSYGLNIYGGLRLKF